MKSIKYFLPLIVLFLSIGYAATNVTLSITGDVITMSDIEDFDVYISDIKVDGVTDISLLVDNKTFSYQMIATKKVNQSATITYSLTNNSSSFDAQVSFECIEETQGIDEMEVLYNNSFEGSDTTYTSDTTIASKNNKNGVTTFERHGPAINGYLQFTCTITAEPIERKELGVGETPDKIEPPKIKYHDSDASGYIDIGDVVDISGEKFNIISADEENVVMLAQQSLGSNYKQSKNPDFVTFSENNEWEYEPGPKEIDIQTWSTKPKEYINEYIKFIKKEIDNVEVKGDLITLEQLGALGCSYPETYFYDTDSTRNRLSCDSSENFSWLINGKYWWTKSAMSNKSDGIWEVTDDGNSVFMLGDVYNSFYANNSVRPTITIPYATFKELSKTPKETLISFYIDETKYYAKPDMTWEEWIDSTYSNGNFIIIGNKENITTKDMSQVITYNNTEVTKDEKIQQYDEELLFTLKGYSMTDPT